MNTPSSYRAPWGTTLKIVSVAVSAICLGLFAAQFTGPFSHFTPHSVSWVRYLLPLLIVGTAPFVVRGYAIRGDTLLIERLFWTTRIPLEGLLSATVEPRAMRSCLRTCGNGGMFSFTGWYWSRPLGHFRAFVTDLTRTVVLRFADRTVVISPEHPEEFVREISHRSQV